MKYAIETFKNYNYTIQELFFNLNGRDIYLKLKENNLSCYEFIQQTNTFILNEKKSFKNEIVDYLNENIQEYIKPFIKELGGVVEIKEKVLDPFKIKEHDLGKVRKLDIENGNSTILSLKLTERFNYSYFLNAFFLGQLPDKCVNYYNIKNGDLIEIKAPYKKTLLAYVREFNRPIKNKNIKTYRLEIIKG